MSPRIRAVLAVLMVVAAGLAATPASAAPYERNGVYAVGGNKFIIRARQEGGTIYLRAYRLTGDQWERFGGTSLPASEVAARRQAVRNGGGGLIERIYFGGRLIGYSDIDLDNPLNTDLNRNLNCFSCN